MDNNLKLFLWKTGNVVVFAIAADSEDARWQVIEKHGNLASILEALGQPATILNGPFSEVVWLQ